ARRRPQDIRSTSARDVAHDALVTDSSASNAGEKHAMGTQDLLMRAVVALVPACMVFTGSLVLLIKGVTPSSFLQLLGATSFVVVVLAHVCEALHLFPSMGWGLERSPGHYLDLLSAVLGLICFPLGYLVHVLDPERR